MNLQEVWRNLFNKSRGRFFSVVFKKKNGEIRFLNGKIFQTIMPDDIDSSGHIVVLDVKKNEFRKINLSNIEAFSCAELTLGFLSRV